MRNEEQAFGDAICLARDVNEISAVLLRANVADVVYRELAAVLAADVVRCVARSPHQAATRKAAHFACAATRISLLGSHRGPFLVAAVCAAAEASLLSAEFRATTDAIRLHQADVARAFLTPAVFGQRTGGTCAA